MPFISPTYMPREIQACMQKYIYKTMFMTSLFVIASKQKHCRCPCAVEWKDTLCCVCTMEYFTSVKVRNYVSMQ